MLYTNLKKWQMGEQQKRADSYQRSRLLDTIPLNLQANSDSAMISVSSQSKDDYHRENGLDVKLFAALLLSRVTVALGSEGGTWGLWDGPQAALWGQTMASSVLHQVGLEAESFISATVLHLFFFICYCYISPSPPPPPDWQGIRQVSLIYYVFLNFLSGGRGSFLQN